MKKISILLLSAFAMAVASCDDAPEVPPMQTNPQEPVLEAGDIAGVTVGVLAQTDVFNLETAETEVDVFTFTQAEDLPEDASLTPVLELSNTPEFTTVEKLSLQFDDETSTYAANSESWNTAHIALFGKSPKEKTAYYRIPVYITYGGTEYRYQSPDYYIASGTITETCKDAGFTIASAYYIIGDMNGWDLSLEGLEDYKFNHSNADVYDDPVFTITVTVPDACYWKIAPIDAVEEGNWDGLYGPLTDGDTAFEGMLFEITEGGKAGEIEAGGLYRFTINMESMEYVITPINYPEYLYTPGDVNGWGFDGCQMLYSTEDGNYYGYAVLGVGGFKFTTSSDWDHTNYGIGDGENTISETGDNISVDETNLYWCVVNVNDLTYQLTKITTIGIIGGFEENSWGSDVATLTPSDDFLTWTGEVKFTEGVEWKFRANEGWDVNLGGSSEDLKQNGANLVAPGEGTYQVTLNLSTLPYAVTLTKK